MKVKPGDTLKGTNPCTGKIEYFRYIGKSDGVAYDNGFKRILHRKGDKFNSIYQEASLKEYHFELCEEEEYKQGI